MLDEDAPRDPPPTPMWAPFGLIGAAASFFSMLGVSVLLTDNRFASPWPALGVGAVVGALAGGALRRWRALRDPWLTSGRRLLRVGLVVLAAGALCGALAAGLGASDVRHVLPGGLNGVLCAALFIPGAASVLDAAARATRARHGSLVAAADRRSVWTAALVVVAAAPSVAVPATAVGLVSRAIGPRVQPLLVLLSAAVGLVGLVALEVAERRARARLEVVLGEISQLSPAAAHDVASREARDLGLGDAGFSRLHARDAYRGARHGEVVVRGDPGEALEALDDAVGRRRRARVVGVLALLGSALALLGQGDTSRIVLR